MGAVQDERHRDSSVLTFLVTASGMSFLGLGAAFWGLVIGITAHLVLHRPCQTAALAITAKNKS